MGCYGIRNKNISGGIQGINSDEPAGGLNVPNIRDPAQSTLSDDTQQLPTQHLPVLKGAR